MVALVTYVAGWVQSRVEVLPSYVQHVLNQERTLYINQIALCMPEIVCACI